MDAAAHSQMRDRIWEPGANHKKAYVYVRAHKTTDGFVKRILDTKMTAQEALLDIGFNSAAFGEEEEEEK